MEEKTILAQILQVLDLYAADMRKQFEALHEKFDSLQRQVQALNEKTDEMDKRIEEMDGRFERQIAQLERTVNERFERLEAKLGHIRVELTRNGRLPLRQNRPA